MKTLRLFPWKLALVATAAGAIGTSAVQGQIGPGGSGLPETASSATTQELDAGRSASRFGTADFTDHTLQAFAFESLSTGDFVEATFFGSRYCATGNCFLRAALVLPAGALIEAIELEGCDTDPDATVAANLWRTDALESDITLLAGIETGIHQTPGCDFVLGELSSPETVDNFESTYFVEVLLEGDTTETRFQAVRVIYRLQVSPPPARATFDDVPTDHPFFPFVEALAASEITSGCGGGNYCPGAPLTRGQMAVFLARALGLDWASPR